MHRCEVKMRRDRKTPDENLLACGDEALKKLGRVWVCNYHYEQFRHVEDDLGYEEMSMLKRISDCREVRDE